MKTDWNEVFWPSLVAAAWILFIGGLLVGR
jgi:hypothetical protein